MKHVLGFRAVILGTPVSKNVGERLSKFGTKYVTPKTRAWQQDIRAAVREAVKYVSDWPSDPFIIDHLRYSVYKYNTGVDHDAGNTYLADCLQYQQINTQVRKEPDVWGLIWNDKVLSLGESPMPFRDDGATRTEIVFSLIAIGSPIDAAARRQAWEESQQRRKERRKLKNATKRKAKKEALQ